MFIPILLFFLIQLTSFGGEDRRELKLKLGYTQTTGNTNTKTLSLGLNVDVSKGKYSNKLTGRVLYGESRGRKTIERVNLKNRSRLNWESLFLFWDITFHRDPFRLYNQRYATGPGVGREWKLGKKTDLSASVYVYYYYEKLSRHQPSRREYLMYNFGQELRHKLSDRVSIIQKLSFSQSNRESGDYFLNTSLKLVSKLTQLLSLEILYRLSYQNKPVERGIKKTDTFLITSIVINF
jgi:putative salt-induced outer membrane protein